MRSKVPIGTIFDLQNEIGVKPVKQWKDCGIGVDGECCVAASGRFWRAGGQTKTRPFGRVGNCSQIRSDERRSGNQRTDAMSEARDLAGGGVLVNHALLRGPHELRLSSLQRGGGGALVAGGDRLLDLAQEGTHAAAARLVHPRCAARSYAWPSWPKSCWPCSVLVLIAAGAWQSPAGTTTNLQ